MRGAVTPSLAGTIMVAVEDGGVRVLMLRRRPELRFMGGYWVFPGGAADASETAAAADPITIAATAACRELHEEAGLTLAPQELVRWAHWITPDTMTRRFDTHFFLARLPAGQQPRLDLNEASDMCWVTPADHAYTHGPSTEFPITAPTQMVLRELAEGLRQSPALQTLMAGAAQRAIVTVLPKMHEPDVVFPWDPEYPHLQGEGCNWDAAQVKTRAGWPSRLPAHVAHPGPKPAGG